MIIARRSLKISEGGKDREVAIDIHAPEPARVDWICRYEIDWPEGKVERHAGGTDPYKLFSRCPADDWSRGQYERRHRPGQLEWLAKGRGYGFPVPNNIRDLLVSDDR